MNAEALKGHLDGLILATLANEPAHGYAIAQELRGRSGGTFEIPEGTLYPALHRLERGGLITSEWSVEAGRRRRTYRLTRSGERSLGERRSEWRIFASAIDAVLAWSWLTDFDEELRARRVRRPVRERLVTELTDHLACEEGQETRLALTRLGAAREIAGQCADELASDDARRGAFVAFAALALTAVVLAVTQTAVGAIGYPGFDRGISTALSLPAIGVIVFGSQVALVAGVLAAWRALRRRGEAVLPGAEVALIARRTRVALAAGIAVTVAILAYAVNFSSVLPAWWLALTFSLAGVSSVALGAAWRVGARGAGTLALAPGPAGDLFDDLPPLRALRGHPVRLCAGLALASATAMTLFEWHAEHSLAEGLQRGIAEGLAFTLCFAALGRIVGARR